MNVAVHLCRPTPCLRICTAGGLELGERIGARSESFSGESSALSSSPNVTTNLSGERTPSLSALQQRRELMLQQLAASGARLEVDGQVDLAAQLEKPSRWSSATVRSFGYGAMRNDRSTAATV